MPTSLGIEKMDITFCFEPPRTFKDETGMGRQPIRQLPWCFVRFNDPGEEQKYVMPLPPSVMSCGNGIYTEGMKNIIQAEPGTFVMSYGRAFMTYMDNVPWPVSKHSHGRENDVDDSVHWFGGG